MANRKRHLGSANTLLLAIIAIFATVPLQSVAAVPPVEPPAQFRVLATGNPVPLAGLLYELDGKSVPIHSSDVSLSPSYRKPGAGPLVLYREIAPVPPAKTPQKIPVASVHLGDSSLVLLVLKADNRGQVAAKVIDDSWESFPPQTVRVLSFSRHKIAAQVEDLVTEIPPSAAHLFPYSSNKPRIRIKVASLSEDTWRLRFNNSQAIVPGHRVNMLLIDFEPSPQDPTPDGINVIKMIDPLTRPSPAN